MKKNNNGFSIALAMGLVIFINIIALSIMEYIIPFSKNTKSIENSLVAYYQANSGIENALYDMKGKEVGYENSNSGGTTIFNSFDITGKGDTLPPIGEGNSEYDPDWNIISMGNPIQLEIGSGMLNFDVAEFAFRVPNLKDGDTLTLSGGSDLPIINWQISSQKNTLNSSGSHIFADDMCTSTEIFTNCILDLSDKDGVDLNGDEQEIIDFYGDTAGDGNCYDSGSGCILKLSVINKLEDYNDGISIPYLEWQIYTGVSGDEIPLRYTKITTVGKAYGFRKDLEVKIPQQTTNEAFDFTVFQ